MRAFIVACFAVASVCAEAGADADAYTIAQVQSGIPALKTSLDGQTRIVHGLNGVNTVLNRAYAAPIAHAAYSAPIAHAAYSAPIAHAAYSAPVAAYSGYAAPISAYSTLGYRGYAHGLYKREAEAEAKPEADAYTLAQVALGKPIADAYATGHAHNVGYVAGVSAPYVSSYAAPLTTYAHSAYSAPIAHAAYSAPLTTAYSSYAAPISAYSTLGYRGYAHGLYKREAEAEAKPEADAYTLAQVALGKPIADAYATGHAHNVGYVAGVSSPYVSSYAAPLTTYAHSAYSAPLTTAYSGYAAPIRSAYSTLGYRSSIYGGYHY